MFEILVCIVWDIGNTTVGLPNDGNAIPCNLGIDFVDFGAIEIDLYALGIDLDPVSIFGEGAAPNHVIDMVTEMEM